MAAELTLHVERVLPAPQALVFRMHAEPDLLAQWWGPKGFSAPEHRARHTCWRSLQDR